MDLRGAARTPRLDKAAWEAELTLHAELFDKLKYHLPKELEDAKAQLERRLMA